MRALGSRGRRFGPARRSAARGGASTACRPRSKDDPPAPAAAPGHAAHARGGSREGRAPAPGRAPLRVTSGHTAQPLTARGGTSGRIGTRPLPGRPALAPGVRGAHRMRVRIRRTICRRGRTALPRPDAAVTACESGSARPSAGEAGPRGHAPTRRSPPAAPTGAARRRPQSRARATAPSHAPGLLRPVHHRRRPYAPAGNARVASPTTTGLAPCVPARVRIARADASRAG